MVSSAYRAQTITTSASQAFPVRDASDDAHRPKLVEQINGISAVSTSPC